MSRYHHAFRLLATAVMEPPPAGIDDAIDVSDIFDRSIEQFSDDTIQLTRSQVAAVLVAKALHDVFTGRTARLAASDETDETKHKRWIDYGSEDPQLQECEECGDEHSGYCEKCDPKPTIEVIPETSKTDLGSYSHSLDKIIVHYSKANRWPEMRAISRAASTAIHEAVHASELRMNEGAARFIVTKELLRDTAPSVVKQRKFSEEDMTDPLQDDDIREQVMAEAMAIVVEAWAQFRLVQHDSEMFPLYQVRVGYIPRQMAIDWYNEPRHEGVYIQFMNDNRQFVAAIFEAFLDTLKAFFRAEVGADELGKGSDILDMFRGVLSGKIDVVLQAAA